jgi:hypothetical protein
VPIAIIGARGEHGPRGTGLDDLFTNPQIVLQKRQGRGELSLVRVELEDYS